MPRILSALTVITALLGGSLAPQYAWADKPERGGPPHGRSAQGGPGNQGNQGNQGGTSISIHIGSGNEAMIRDYYRSAMQGGRCPPGLAKKHNGCMPPGQAKKWQLGRPLPRDVIFHPLPQDLSIRLSSPQNARFVRVAGDILLIAVGTGMVLDAIEDLSRL